MNVIFIEELEELEERLKDIEHSVLVEKWITNELLKNLGLKPNSDYSLFDSCEWTYLKKKKK